MKTRSFVAAAAFAFATSSAFAADGDLDPTFGTIPADATHVTLAEGETAADLVPLTDWVGRLKVKVMEVRY